MRSCLRAGYANFPDDVQGNILNNYCVLDPTKSSYADHPPRIMLPAFGAITLTVLMAYPINVYPTRYAIEVMCYPKAWQLPPSDAHAPADLGGAAADSKPAKMGGWAKVRHVVLTLAIASVSLVTALVLPNINTVFALMGGTCSAYVHAPPTPTQTRPRKPTQHSHTRLPHAPRTPLSLVSVRVRRRVPRTVRVPCTVFVGSWGRRACVRHVVGAMDVARRCATSSRARWRGSSPNACRRIARSSAAVPS
jgi:hypothetical protein